MRCNFKIHEGVAVPCCKNWPANVNDRFLEREKRRGKEEVRKRKKRRKEEKKKKITTPK